MECKNYVLFQLLSRRRECDEGWLVSTLIRLRQQKQLSLSETRKKTLLDRTVRELVELMSPKKAGSGELTGRESGSLAWRLARGETGPQGGASNAPKPTVIKPTQAEIEKNLVHLKYCCATDKYVRVSEGDQVTKGWGHMISEVKDVFRKEEPDWKMCYLARDEGTNEASVSWTFDFTGKSSKCNTSHGHY